MDIFAFIVVLALVSSNNACLNGNGNADSFNVMDYGAVSDGVTDDSQAFLKAWNAACSTATGTPKVLIPGNKTFLLIPVIFSGPCKAKQIDFLISGTILAPASPSAWNGGDASQWLAFHGIRGLNVSGLGTIDGQGKGDDCVSIGDYTSNVKVANVVCGPGHGISIGSLGRGGNFVQVENIHVGKGYVRNVTFEDLKFDSVKNPIIIDQNYCDVRGACKELPTGVHLSNVTYKEFSGTSSTGVAINLNCSRSVACTGILMEFIKLTSAKAGKQVTSSCSNAHGKETEVVPGPCLQN
ncbi:hypothetical protein F0562_009443 [Nyssa sinensis]|uniref:Pectate lyase superfamily protein domain-containing protein n=1 Tax=Nyssa sinensis TaxID=561372 RepID=A0A5J4ZXI6_9ASTE|nr:hypothetical protein F0562_009443 [Nyssa sinensis]